MHLHCNLLKMLHACTCTSSSALQMCSRRASQALDAWGNATGPAEQLEAEVEVSCEGIDPAVAAAALSPGGMALFDGLRLHL